MRVSKALAVAAAVLAPAALIIIPAGHASAESHPCGAITMNPDCHPLFAPEVPRQNIPQFPYSQVMTASMPNTAMSHRVVQLPADGSCQGSLAQSCAMPATSNAAATSGEPQALTAAAPPTSLHGLLPLASDQAAASPAAHHNSGLPVAPVAAAGALLATFGAVTLYRRKQHSN